MRITTGRNNAVYVYAPSITDLANILEWVKHNGGYRLLNATSKPYYRFKFNSKDDMILFLMRWL